MTELETDSDVVPVLSDRDRRRLVDDYLSSASAEADLVRIFGLPETDYGNTSPNPIITHCAKIFLNRHYAIKVKLPVNYSYLQMTTLSDRRKFLLREYELNVPSLPDIYLEVIAIVRTEDGQLRFACEDDKTSQVLEWALIMKRFNEGDVLDNIAKEQRLSKEIARQLGSSVASYHDSLEPQVVKDGYSRIQEVVTELVQEFQSLTSVLSRESLDRFREDGNFALVKHDTLLRQRGQDGFIRRCHGDLHLRNLLMHNNTPVPFDALEFNERFATTDVLYDLAFLLMDLNHRGLAEHENTVLNEYLLHSNPENVRGLSVLPLFLYCRAGIRAMTSAQAVRQSDSVAEQQVEESQNYLHSAHQYLTPRIPFVLAVGGFSGSGKSTVAARLPNRLCPSPGALLLRSDAERKAAFELRETEHLGESHYANPENSQRVYKRILRKVHLAVAAGYPVIVDAAFMNKDQQTEIEQIALRAGVPFQGLWLEAAISIMRERISHRTGDASDATVAVLDKQYREFKGTNHWTHIDTSGTIDENMDVVMSRLSVAGL